MSQRDLLRMTNDELMAFLEEGRTVYVASHNGDGTVQVVPMMYGVLDGYLTFYTDPLSRKVRNLRRDPHITCLVEIQGNNLTEHRAAQIVGIAEIVDDREASMRVGKALMQRYSEVPLDEQALTYLAENLASVRVAVVVKPERVVSWDHGKVPGADYVELGH